MKKNKLIIPLILVFALGFGVYLYASSFSKAETALEARGYQVIEKKISFHGFGRPYSQYKDDIVVQMTVAKEGQTYQAYYQQRWFFLESLYISKYSLENQESYLKEADYSSPGSKHNFHKIKLK